jgi:hypothetical protein
MSDEWARLYFSRISQGRVRARERGRIKNRTELTSIARPYNVEIDKKFHENISHSVGNYRQVWTLHNQVFLMDSIGNKCHQFHMAILSWAEPSDSSNSQRLREREECHQDVQSFPSAVRRLIIPTVDDGCFHTCPMEKMNCRESYLIRRKFSVLWIAVAQSVYHFNW